MKLKAYLEVWEKDRRGRFISYKRIKVHSFVIAMLDMMYAHMAVGSAAIIDTGGTSRSYPSVSSLAFKCNAASGDNTFGIQVGTGTNAVSLTNYCLQTLIAHGTGSGQLSYGAVSLDVPVTSGTSRFFRIMRTFTNNSGASITVNEIGLASNAYSTWKFLLERTLLTFTITNGSSKTVRYTIQITV